MTASFEPTGAPVAGSSLRYPEAAIEVLDAAFLRYRIFSASIERLGSGLRWAEGPV